jgi:hypothetical protein
MTLLHYEFVSKLLVLCRKQSERLANSFGKIRPLQKYEFYFYISHLSFVFVL